MKRSFIFLVGLFISLQQVYSQLAIKTWEENFDTVGVMKLLPDDAQNWKIVSDYFESPPNAYRGIVPNMTGESIVLETPLFNFTGMANVYIRFNHICKISPRDQLRLEYQVNQNAWAMVPGSYYLGGAIMYENGFSAASYYDWLSDDSLKMPEADWWKEEYFDLTHLVGGESSVKFRFVLQRGDVKATQIAYGWLLDDLKVTYSTHMLENPSVELLAPVVKDTVYAVGPYEIKAEIKTTSFARLETPEFTYTAVNDEGTFTDRFPMTNTSGDIWTADIPAFPMGTHVDYSITARDTTGNETIVEPWYYIAKYTGAGGVTFDYIYFYPDDTLTGGSNGQNLFYPSLKYSWSRHLYLNGELTGVDPLRPQLITDISWYSSNATNINPSDIRVYLKATKETTNNTAAWIDPDTIAGAVLVYRGQMITGQGWNTLQLQTAFVFPPNHNIMVYFVDSSHVAPGAKSFVRTSNLLKGIQNNAGYEVDPSAPGGYRSVPVAAAVSFSPLVRFGVGEMGNTGDYSAGLTSIDNPVKGAFTGGTSTPIVVTVHNKGVNTLDSVTVYWEINSGNTYSKVWKKGNLLPDFKMQDTIGYFMSSTGGFDTVKVWLNSQNGLLTDAITYDDTLCMVLYACDQPIVGWQEIGAGKKYPSIDALFLAYQDCGSGDLIMALADDVYPALDLSNLSLIMGNHSLTITSISGNAKDAIIRPASGEGIILNNTDNLTLKAITVDAATSGTYAIRFTGPANNVLIRDCRLLADTVSTASGKGPVWKGSDTRLAHNISFINNHLDGGYYGIYFRGTGANSNGYNTNIIFDSNLVTNSAYMGTYPYTSWFTARYNTIISRSANIYVDPNFGNTSWTGMGMWYANGDHIGNRIIQHNPDIVYPRGIYLNDYNTTANTGGNNGIIANNEIQLISTETNPAYSAATGISSASSTYRADILHNSIHIIGTGGSRGISLINAPSLLSSVKNNNIVMESPDAYPVYISNLANLDIDYNNMYAPEYVGFASSAHKSLDSWRSIITTDNNSVSIQPQFANIQAGLKISNYADYLCPLNTLVDEDIEETTRTITTVMGCYEDIPDLSLNGSLVKCIGLRSGSVSGQSDNLQLLVFNAGSTPLTRFNIGWSVNGTPQTAVTANLNAPLAKGYYDTIPLGQIDYTSGATDVKIWINSLNPTASVDQNHIDDTLHFSVYDCVNGLSGNIEISSTGAYATIEEALNVIKFCGLSGNAVLLLDDGVYDRSIDLAEISTQFGNYSLTITSLNGNAEDVIIRPASGAGILLDNSNNIILRDITVDARLSKSHAIYFRGACSDVTIRNCELYADMAKSAEAACGIYKPSSNPDNNISIVNNVIDGGYANIYFAAGNANTNRGTNISIDSNMVRNHYHTGVHLLYGDAATVFHNTVLRHPASTATAWQGVCVEYVNGQVVGNKIHQLGDEAATAYGIYLTNFNYTGATGNGLVANNEIIANTSGYYGGIYSSTANIDILHNSILVKGTGNASGIYVYSGFYQQVAIVKNNNIVMEATGAYPIFVNHFFLDFCTFDYNNMYAPTYVGSYYNPATWAVEDISDMQTWRSYVTSDQHSDTIKPRFLDANTSLQMSLDERLLCPILSQVPTDIEGNSRGNAANTTTMGAYSGYLPTADLGLLDNIIQTGIVNNSQQVPIYVEAWNLGSTYIDSANFSWSLNGTDQPSYAWKASNPLSPYNKAKIMLGSFPATAGTTYEIKIWINTVNGATLTTTHNDTLEFELTPQLVDLAWFEEPLITDTISVLSFDVYTQIIEETGATVNTPEMNIQTILDNGLVFYDTIEIDYINGYWIASVPQQYYGSKVIYSLTVTDTLSPVPNTITITDSTYITQQGSELYAGYNLSVYSIEKLVADGELCSGDYASVQITVTNTGENDYDFSVNPITLSVELTTPNPFNRNLLVNTGTLPAGESKLMEITNMLPIANAGLYDVKAWVNCPLDKVVYDDTITLEYQSNKYPLPIDEGFNADTIPVEFKSIADNSTYKWEVVAQDGSVNPQEGAGMLAFSGSRGAMSTLQTQRLDLSRAVSPELSFWYYHDNVVCEDDMIVRLTVDGGATYSRLFYLKKYDAALAPGWYEYKTELPAFAVNRCVILEFEALERSDNYVAQYLDHILITAQQILEITDVITSVITSACDLKNKELKVVLYNNSDPILDYASTPLDFTIELAGTSQSFTVTKNTGIVGSFSYDTITVKTGFNFVLGKHILWGNISSIFGEIHADTVDITPNFTIEIEKLSKGGLATAEIEYKQKVTITNTGNLDLPAITLELSVDTAQGKTYFAADATTQSLAPGESQVVEFTRSYIVPWNAEYDVNILAYLACNSSIIKKTGSEQERVNMTDLYIVNIENPADDQSVDAVGSEKEVSVKIRNRNIGDDYTGVNVGVLILDADGVRKQNFTEDISYIGSGATVTHNFTKKYTVPAGEYILIVYIESEDNYPQNDTMKMVRNKGVNLSERVGVSFSMEQNIPNPAKGKTFINYSIPQDGEIAFHIYSISGQLLYKKTEIVFSGNNQIDLNISGYASGVYFYTMEYQGQRITKRMSITR